MILVLPSRCVVAASSTTPRCVSTGRALSVISSGRRVMPHEREATALCAVRVREDTPIGQPARAGRVSALPSATVGRVEGGSAMNHVPTRLDAHIRDNPLTWKWWVPKNGGYVLALGGWKVYYGRCRECSVLVTTRRQAVVNGKYRSYTGRWPDLCAECYETRRREHDAKAAERVRRKRAEQRAFRDAQYADRGWELPKRGRPRGGGEPRTQRGWRTHWPNVEIERDPSVE